MKFNTIRIEGPILSSDILDKIEQGELGGQLPKDFGFDASVKVKDEIVKAWADAQDFWRIFQRHRGDVAQGATGTSETRKFWILPLLGLLGYDLELSKAESVNGKTYAVSHRAKNLDGYPVHIMGFNDSLDKKREDSGPRMSPHALVQEYLNLTEHLYAIVTNGTQLRLLRDSSRLIKLSFIEFDLEAMMEEEQYADFAVMYRLIHAMRMPGKIDAGAESLIEKYHQDALDSGSRIRDGLSAAVKYSIEALANGFLKHPANTALKDECANKRMTGNTYYKNLLRLIYRLLFLMVIEERDLIYPKGADHKKRDIYYHFYSLVRLRKLCEKNFLEEDHYDDHWIGLRNTFRLFESEDRGSHLDIKPLAGDLFGYDAIGMLSQCSLDNQTLLLCLKNLSVFEHPKTGQKVRVNYAALNTEEFGSVYEGLLEYAPQIISEDGRFRFVFAAGSERSATGTHYTPDELCQPLIRYSLDYIIAEKLKEPDKEKALLSIRTCDVAAGSGHILLNAARRIGFELARVRTGEDQPSPAAYRTGIRDAIKSCIYGVDKNPLAVELCKVSLWLEAHIPGEPLNFLDHHIKCGDSIVGLAHKEELKDGIANEAFKTLPGDEKEIAQSYSKRNKAARKISEQNLVQLDAFFQNVVEEPLSGIMVTWEQVNQIPENTPAEIEAKQRAYNNLISGPRWLKLKTIADMQVAQFFIPKTTANNDCLVTDADYRQYLSGHKTLQESTSDKAIKRAVDLAQEKHFFHWFLEFPEVFVAGGFDYIVGNPPYLAGRYISGTFGDNYLCYLKYTYPTITGQSDYVTYFLIRAFHCSSINSFISYITTNTISQGDTCKGGLEYLINQGCVLHYVKDSIRWPGSANLDVSVFSLSQQKQIRPKILNGKTVDHISPRFSNDNESNPKLLTQNCNCSFKGSDVFGMGYILDENECQSLIKVNNINRNVIYPFIVGDDINNLHNLETKRYVINFHDWSEDEAKKYNEPYNRIKELVLPIRLKSKRKAHYEKWWQYGEKRPGLYRTISSLNKVIVISQISKYFSFCMIPNKYVYSQNLIVFPFEKYMYLSILQSTIHNDWAIKYKASFGKTPIYTPTDVFENYPFPNMKNNVCDILLEQIGETYHEHRRQLMLKIQLGLTKTYNLFHSPKLAATEASDMEMDDKSFEKKFGKDAALFRKHLAKTKGTCSFNEAVEGIIKLRELHVEMDNAVLEAYGWSDVQLRHDFFEVDYLPENDRIRYTISPATRREVLKRLLLLNHEIHAREIAAEQQPAPATKPRKGKKQKGCDTETIIF